MTKKDYEAIATIIRRSRSWGRWNLEDVQAIGYEIAKDIAEVCAADNPRFDRARFLAACRGEDSTDSAGRKVRYSIPARCDGEAKYQAQNGYRSCEAHLEKSYGVFEPHQGGRCDYPLDGLGAARYEKR